MGKITEEGIFIEELEHNPSRFAKGIKADDDSKVVKINLDQPMDNILKYVVVVTGDGVGSSLSTPSRLASASLVPSLSPEILPMLRSWYGVAGAVIE